MLANILVPLDGSALSEAALPLAGKLARRSPAILHLVRIHVTPTQPPLSLEGMPLTDPDADAACWESERAYLRRIRMQLVPRSGLVTRTAVLNGPVAEVLTTYAAFKGIDVIVMGTHARHGLARSWMGSVAEDVLRHSRVPVLLVRGAEPVLPAALSAHPPRILIALDGSAIAERVVEPALSLGRALDAEYTLLRVLNPLGLLGDLPFVVAPRMGRAAALEQETEAKDYLNEIAWWMNDRGVKTRTKVAVSERTADTILAEAEREGAAFIAMGTHGRSGLSRMLMGSVAGQVQQGTTIPLLLYRPERRVQRLHAQPSALAAT